MKENIKRLETEADEAMDLAVECAAEGNFQEAESWKREADACRQEAYRLADEN